MIFANNQVPLRFVAEEIAMQTDLPVKNQKLICKGKSIVNIECTNINAISWGFIWYCVVLYYVVHCVPMLLPIYLVVA